MSVEKDNIKDLFSSKLSNFEPDVPASVWSGIDLLLPQIPHAAPAPDPSSSSTSASAGTTAAKTSVIKTIAVITGLAAAVTAGVIILIPEENITIPVQDDEKTIVAADIKDTLDIEADTLPNTIAPITSFVRSAIAKNEAKEITSTSAPATVGNKDDVSDKNEPKQEEKKKKQLTPANEQLFASDSPSPLAKKSSKGFSLGFGGNAGLASENINKNGSALLVSKSLRSNKFTGLLDKENSQFYMEHRQPISLGLTLSKRLTARLSVETGLVYTYLSSRVTSSSVYNIDESQRFYYLGIPLSLNYTLYKAGKTNIYWSLGGMVQKDVSGRYISNVNIQQSDNMTGEMIDIFYSEPYYIRTDISQPNLQFSVHTGLGVSYPIYRNLSLYGAFGAAYYFDAGNTYRTIFSDRPTQLDLNLGVRFDF